MSKQVFGHLSLLFFSVLTAASSVLIHQVEMSISPIAIASYSFLFCTIFYLVIS